jgi:hypothetical protein
MQHLCPHHQRADLGAQEFPFQSLVLPHIMLLVEVVQDKRVVLVDHQLAEQELQMLFQLLM